MGKLTLSHKKEISEGKLIKREWIDIDGNEEFKSIKEMSDKYGMSKSALCRVYKGTLRRAGLWTMKNNTYFTREQIFKGIKNWIHSDGTVERNFMCSDLMKKYGLQRHAHLYGVAKGELEAYKGWRLLK